MRKNASAAEIRISICMKCLSYFGPFFAIAKFHPDDPPQSLADDAAVSLLAFPTHFFAPPEFTVASTSPLIEPSDERNTYNMQV